MVPPGERPRESIIAGGLMVTEPAADLGVIAAVASSLRNRPVRPATAMFGEVGLAGEIRGTTQASLRVKEASQLGFTRCVIPHTNQLPSSGGSDMQLVGVRTVEEALEALIG